MFPSNRFVFPSLGLIALVIGLATSFAQGQSVKADSSRRLWWANVGLGDAFAAGGLGGDPSGIAFGANVTHLMRHHTLSFRFIHGEELKFFSGASPTETVWDVGVLYGSSKNASYGMASLGIGLAATGGTQRGERLGKSGGWFFSTTYYERITFFTLGVALEGQLFWKPLSFAGIGIYGYANLNMEKSFAGALFCLQIGRLR